MKIKAEPQKRRYFVITRKRHFHGLIYLQVNREQRLGARWVPDGETAFLLMPVPRGFRAYILNRLCRWARTDVKVCDASGFMDPETGLVWWLHAYDFKQSGPHYWVQP